MAVRPYHTLALCAGAGGLELGVELAVPHARCVAYVEREAYAAGTLVARMETGELAPAPVWSDLSTFDARPWRGRIHCVTSGDPCQPNSISGKRQGDKDDRFLIEQVLRVVDECRPHRLFRENVTGNADGQLAALVPALERMGMRVAVGIFSASEVGAWHDRERMFLMADTGGEGFSRSQFIQLDIGEACRGAASALGSTTQRGADGRGTSDPRYPEPGLGRTADGVAQRLERLWQLGNGVYPLAAGHAWLALDALLAECGSAAVPTVIAA